MNTEQALKSEGIYLKNDVIAGQPCSIGYIKQFRWSWMATQMNTFVIIAHTANLIDHQTIEAFSANCFKYSLKNNKGWPRGLQSGVTSIAILTGENVDPGAINFCTTSSKKHWSAFEIPIVFNTAKKETYRFNKNPIWGRLYYPYFSQLIDKVSRRLIQN
jgi:hypothetical protein